MLLDNQNNMEESVFLDDDSTRLLGWILKTNRSAIPLAQLTRGSSIG